MTQSGETEAKKSGAYDPREVEARLYASWKAAGYFHGKADSDKPPYSVVIPPPNVTAILHLGHALNNTIQDVLVRRKRMDGFEAEWVPGTDHAGIATQVLVEKLLIKEGKNRRDLGRDAFVERTRQFADDNRGNILGQLARIGCSLDWDRTRYTLDPGLSEAVFRVFRHLFEKGLIYRGNRIVNWCPNDKTSLSDDEVEHETIDSFLWHIRYKVQGADDYLTVATTRPETMLGDTAIAVHPKDPRYQRFIGKKVILPIVERELPIIGDTYVEMEFGTGVLKITPAHDANDFEVATRHDLPAINVLNTDGTMNDEAGKFKGLDRFAARTQLVEELKRKGHIEKIEPYKLPARTCYRCHSMIEPYLSKQWFVRMSELAAPAIEEVKAGRLKFYPEFWTKTYLHWMENIRDWCISRQLWWGHRIPVWYAPDGTMFISQQRPSAEGCPGYDPNVLVQDDDVLDTWFSSWLWPFTTMGWPEETRELKKFYPTTVLVTASEIIFLWVARMVMAGFEFMGRSPFSDVYIHGTVRDANGIKMSKSLGNGIDPLEIIDQHGADALRISLTLATPDGSDPWISKNTFENGRNFVNKLYQVSRFVLMRLDGQRPSIDAIDRGDLILVDRWILSRLGRTIEAVQRSCDDYRLAAASKSLYNFVWDDYCSWYVELIKPDQPGQVIRPGSLQVAAYVLDKITRLLHPFVPFVTEEIHHQLTGDETATLSFGPGAGSHAEFIDDALEQRLRLIQELVNAVRSIRSELNVPPGRRSDLYIKVGDEATKQLLADHVDYFRSLAKMEQLHCGPLIKKPPFSASAVIAGAEIFVPLQGLIDVEVEKQRLQKNLDELKGHLERLSKKLGNADFLANAPADVIEKEKIKRQDFEERIEKLNRNLEQIMGW